VSLLQSEKTLLFAEHLSEAVLLRLPHRQFVFTQVAWPSRSRRLRPGSPKALRVFLRHNRRLFAEISKMIFAMISNFYLEVAGKEIDTGMVIAHLRFFTK